MEPASRATNLRYSDDEELLLVPEGTTEEESRASVLSPIRYSNTLLSPSLLCSCLLEPRGFVAIVPLHRVRRARVFLARDFPPEIHGPFRTRCLLPLPRPPADRQLVNGIAARNRCRGTREIDESTHVACIPLAFAAERSGAGERVRGRPFLLL